MGMSADANLFYGYTLPEDVELSGAATDTYLNDTKPVRIGYGGYQNQSAYVEAAATAVWVYDYGTKLVDPSALLAALPADADDQLRPPSPPNTVCRCPARRSTPSGASRPARSAGVSRLRTADLMTTPRDAGRHQ